MILVNIPYISYFSPEEVHNYKDNMYIFSNSHKNPISGLFIEPEIDINFHIIDAINWTDFNPTLFNLIDPRNNPYMENKPFFFLDYLFGKQNNDGSFSDIGYLGNMFSTYEVVQTINLLNDTFINPTQKQDEIDKMIQFVNNSLDNDPVYENSSGFKLNSFSMSPDIISTSNAIALINNFSVPGILNNENISTYINSSRVAGGYSLDSLTFTPDPESTYYGIEAFLNMNMTYNSGDLITSWGYFSSLYNNETGGFSSLPFNASDVQSTFYVISSVERLGLPPLLYYNENKTLEFILNCSNSDGGFGLFINDTTSDFKSGWAAMKSLTLLEKISDFNSSQIDSINQVREKYYYWLSEYQASNGLFGHITIESNYYGVLSAIQYYPSSFLKYIDVQNIFNYINSCYSLEDGGYANRPGLNSSLYATYLAIEMYDIFSHYFDDLVLHNKTATRIYLASLQNSDGGFKIGIDIDDLYKQLGSFAFIITSLINSNISTVESTYWAIVSLEKLDALSMIDEKNFTHWIRSCQNSDGGFGLFLGFTYSDIVSTYYALHLFKYFNSEPISKIQSISFLKNAQQSDGSFSPLPTLSILGLEISLFTTTYMAAKALYDFAYQAEDIQGFLGWYELCIDNNTGGVGDYQGFGGDLRNTPYGMIIIDDLRYDRAFDPEPWTTLFMRIIILEFLIIAFFIAYNTVNKVNTILYKRIKKAFRITDKLDITYLKRYPAIHCEDLSIYAGRKLIVNSMSLTLEHGEILGVLGESGAGKSTFVKSLLGMRKFSGINQVYGMDVKKKSKKMRPIYGYVPQDLSKIYQDFTTYQNILYFAKQYGLSERDIRRKAKRILRSLEIEDKMHQQVKNLSGGQKRRVSIAIGLIHDPVIVWMDEPTSGLDPVVRENLWHALTKINEEFNTTLIVITHYPEESRFCNKVAIFGRGRGMIDFGTPQDLLSQLPGGGRTIDLSFSEVQINAIKRLEAIEGIDKALENKASLEYSILSNLRLRELISKIELEFGLSSILEIKQSESKMEQYFRYKAMEVPKEE
ncbi:MAG: ATP-binding cassette domain-containing protein [Promethearchaeota archaeon]